jgi:PAS domain S-box-containing protein
MMPPSRMAGAGVSGGEMGYNLLVSQRSAGVRRTLPPHPSSVGEARRLVRAELDRAGRPDLVENAELLVSELVTNALVHAGTPVEVHARVDAAGLRVEVSDGSGVQPAVRHHSAMAGTGRGLRLVEGLVAAWGVEPLPRGKAVWFELVDGQHGGTGPLVDGEDVGGGVRALGPDGTVQVELLNVPLLLHVAWHQHAETLLRELLLVRLGADPDDDAGLDDLVAHATASEAIALLFAQLPDPGLGDDADELMVTASEPAVSSAREVLSVPPDVVGCFDVLEQALDAANALAEAGALLAPPTQPEVRSFRRWVCAEVQAQGDGGAATPWTEPEVPAGRWRPETGWEVDAVLRSPQSLIAADDTNRIIAVSETALALLGYDRAAELVGRRLVDIIPARYRQAHLAGFSLFLSNGRDPLVDRPVVVPALRRDGTEVPLEITIASELLEGGRHVFVADIEPALAGRR